jgi:hypothetical protein
MLVLWGSWIESRWCLVLGAWCLVLGAWCLVLGANATITLNNA